jgi:hypothetical protein
VERRRYESYYEGIFRGPLKDTRSRGFTSVTVRFRKEEMEEVTAKNCTRMSAVVEHTGRDERRHDDLASIIRCRSSSVLKSQSRYGNCYLGERLTY